MRLPFELRQKDVALPPAMADDVRERAERLEHHCDRIMRCRVTIEGSGNHHRQGHYGVTIDITVPGAELVVHKEEARNLDLALKVAFDAAARRLEDHSRKIRG
jgi:ribosomal subunit interface protein